MSELAASTDILYIAYYFPPVGGAGVQRSLKFCRYLPQHGFRPIVLTGSGATLGRWEPIDTTLAHEVGDDCVILRPETPAPDQRLATRAQRWLGRPSAFAKWWRRQILTYGRRAARDFEPRAIFVSLSPYEGLEAAVCLGNELGLPVIADLRDPWALDEVRIYTSAWHREREVRDMARLLSQCERVIWNTPEARSAAVARIPSLDDARQDCITNGYDASDFEAHDVRTPDETFRILHTGYLHTAMGLAHRDRSRLQRRLGGELFPVDFLPRSHWYLLAALEQLQERSPDIAKTIDLRLVGVLSDADEARIARSSVRDRVTKLGYLDHDSTVAEMVAADLLFLPMHDLPAGPRARIVPGKTYEYLAAGRPILAAVPPGDAQDFVRAAEAGTIVRPTDFIKMADAIEAEIARAPTPRRAASQAVTRFERRALTVDLATVLRGALGTTIEEPTHRDSSAKLTSPRSPDEPDLREEDLSEPVRLAGSRPSGSA
ncbi:MAG: glycosyltransferase [Planctomycetes bacterium]|nr:glycosyltransferase [Planctomycetota bacterium]